jgi:predicted nucleotidyltransferase
MLDRFDPACAPYREEKTIIFCSIDVQKWIRIVVCVADNEEEKLMLAHVQYDSQKLINFCRKHRVLKLRAFGSVWGMEFRVESDVDILVEFEPGFRAGLLYLSGMELELAEIFGRKACLRTPNDLRRYFREEVVNAAEVLYAA